MLNLIRRLQKQTLSLSLASKQHQKPGKFFSGQANPNNIDIFINEQQYSVDKSLTVFQACHEAGIIIPRFCYHERLAVVGNCRMCLVEVERAPKPVASCVAQVMPGMRIKTESE